MDDLTEKLMQIVNNKENMEKIKNLTGMLSSQKTSDSNSTDKPAESSNPLNDIPLESMSKIMKIMPLLSSANKEDENSCFLQALRPHLKENRQKKLDESLKMMQLFKILPILKEQNIF